MNRITLVKTYHKLLTLLVASTLYACSQLPSSVVVSPELLPTNASYHGNKQANLEVIDRRNNIHLLQIMKENKAETLLNSQLPLQQVIKSELSKRYSKAGLNIGTHSASIQISIFIDDALINVNQELFDYSANNQINLQVKISKGEQTLTKSFQQTGNSKAPMTADIAVLERDFSQQLGKVLSNILVDKELQQFLNN